MHPDGVYGLPPAASMVYSVVWIRASGGAIDGVEVGGVGGGGGGGGKRDAAGNPLLGHDGQQQQAACHVL